MDEKATRKLTIVALVILLGTILVHIPVIGFAHGQSANKIFRDRIFSKHKSCSSRNRFWKWRIPEGT